MSERDAFRLARPAWALALRDSAIKYIDVHSKFLASHQDLVNMPFLDRYFLWSSVLGTHTFFMLFLPAVYLLLGPDFGRRFVVALTVSLIMLSTLAVYVTAVLKDFFCIPRPNAPPLKRITLGSHHLEYGFPSTHSANAAGMAVFLYHSLLRWKAFISISGSPDQWSVLDDIVMNTYVMESMISIYAFTIIYGRVYSVGSLTGFIIAVFVLAIDNSFGLFLSWPSLMVPLVIVSISVLMLVVHPIPIRPCPCYEDVVSFDGALTGVALGEWLYNTVFSTASCYPGSSILTSVVPARYLWYIEGHWKLFISQNGTSKFIVAPILSVLPIVIFKVFLSQYIKSAVYSIVVWYAGSRPEHTKTGSDASMYVMDVCRVNDLRKRTTQQKPPAKEQETRPLEPVLSPLAMRVYLDTYRLIVYTIIGLLGSGITQKLLTCLGLVSR